MKFECQVNANEINLLSFLLKMSDAVFKCNIQPIKHKDPTDIDTVVNKKAFQ